MNVPKEGDFQGRGKRRESKEENYNIPKKALVMSVKYMVHLHPRLDLPMNSPITGPVALQRSVLPISIICEARIDEKHCLKSL